MLDEPFDHVDGVTLVNISPGLHLLMYKYTFEDITKPVDDEHPILESQFCFLQEIFTHIILTENISLSFHRMFKVTVTYRCP